MIRKPLLIGIILLLIIAPASATYSTNCEVNNNINITNIISQIQWMSQQQAQQQSQHQEQTVNVAPGATSWIPVPGPSPVIQQTSETYSRLLYPGEVLTFPNTAGRSCSVLAGLPIGFYVIESLDSAKVQSSEAAPVYDPVFHTLRFGLVSPTARIDYWTMKARLITPTDTSLCVVDNRGPFNGYTTIEVVTGA